MTLLSFHKPALFLMRSQEQKVAYFLKILPITPDYDIN